MAEYRDVRKRFVDGGEVTPFGHHAVERRRAAARRAPEHQHEHGTRVYRRVSTWRSVVEPDERAKAGWRREAWLSVPVWV